MEITFQNKREDFEAFCHYMAMETDEGRQWGTRSVLWQQERLLGMALVIGCAAWAFEGDGIAAGLLGAALLGFGEGWMLLHTRFRPLYHHAKAIYRAQAKGLKEKELQFFQLKKTLKADDDWLEVRSAAVVHKWRWMRVDRVSITKDFIFIHVGHCPVIYVPRRDFPSEEAFVEFGDRLVELREAKKDEPIGAE